MYSSSVFVTLDKKKQSITNKFNFYWENLDLGQANTIFQISEKVQPNGQLSAKYKILKNLFLIQKPWYILGILWKFYFLKVSNAPVTNKRICCGHNVSPHSWRIGSTIDALILHFQPNINSFPFVSSPLPINGDFRDSISLLLRILQADWSSSEPEKKIFVSH